MIILLQFGIMVFIVFLYSFFLFSFVDSYQYENNSDYHFMIVRGIC